MRRNSLLLAFVLVFAGALAASAAQAAPQKKADVAAGKTVYARKCAMCHAANGSGNQAIGKALHVTLRALGSKEVQAKSDAELKKESQDGIGKMRKVPGLTPADLNNLVAYMRTMK